MTLPPERISVKRRRQDEPVDTLVLEQGSTHDKKRQFTDFFFRRLQYDQITSAVSQIQPADALSPSIPSRRTADDYKRLGIPVIRSSASSNETIDSAKHSAVQAEKEVNSGNNTNATTRHPQSLNDSSALNLQQQQQRASVATRRFHLTRNLSSPLDPAQAIGARRFNVSLRPPLATFIERRDPHNADQPSMHKQPPVDRIVELDNKDPANLSAGDPIGKKTQINTFFKSSSSTQTKRGISIRDDPTTWDQDSDQLANELAALAFEIDPADATEPPHESPPSDPVLTSALTAVEPMIIDPDDDFVLETYIRVKLDPNLGFPASHHDVEIGVLIIDDENEDLWEKYVQSDDDDDGWDEEDEDSNAEDNPRNEYPDDEVSSDDEFGRNVYKYRRHASDDEEYDESQYGW